MNEELIVKGGESRPQKITTAAAALLEGIEHGRRYEREELAALLRMDAGSMGFQLAMSEINRILEESGYHLTTAGSNGRQWLVTMLEDAASVTRRMDLHGRKLLKRAALFSQAVLKNHGDKLTDMDRRKLEKQAEISARRYLFATRLKFSGRP